MYGSEMTSKFVNKKGEEICLELATPKDVTALAKQYATALDARVRAFLNVGPVIEADELNWLNGQRERQDVLTWIISADGVAIGNCGLHFINLESRNAELGLMICDKQYWGRGIAPVAEAMVTEYAMNNVVAGGLHKITAHVYVRDDGSGNDASRAAIKKVGYVDAGLLREQKWILGQWYDEWSCEMLASDWGKMRLDIFRKLGIKRFDLYPGCEDKGFAPILIE